jgi:hypothetical protein
MGGPASPRGARASGARPPRAGPRSRATELAALALANLAAENTSRRAIRLSGGVPPLARLLTLRPSAQARGRPPPGRTCSRRRVLPLCRALI